MAYPSIWLSAAIPIAEAMNIKPVSADMGSDNAVM
jgi:hypothetical protein